MIWRRRQYNDEDEGISTTLSHWSHSLSLSGRAPIFRTSWSRIPQCHLYSGTCYFIYFFDHMLFYISKLVYMFVINFSLFDFLIPFAFVVMKMKNSESCPYTLIISTSCFSPEHTGDQISISFGDAHGNQVSSFFNMYYV